MTNLQQILQEQNLLEKIEEEYQYGFVYEIFPDVEQRQYIHKNCGCKRKLHNLFVNELYQYLEKINFQKGYIPSDFIKILPTTKSFKEKYVAFNFIFGIVNFRAHNRLCICII